mmetsp:Transcript_4117/g.10178  ORF Transcript_4117/g.10178 Transcript_4117/m.10178 type:complete len:204 (-) Transcript_4117:18-629(-)
MVSTARAVVSSTTTAQVSTERHIRRSVHQHQTAAHLAGATRPTGHVGRGGTAGGTGQDRARQPERSVRRLSHRTPHHGQHPAERGAHPGGRQSDCVARCGTLSLRVGSTAQCCSARCANPSYAQQRRPGDSAQAAARADGSLHSGPAHQARIHCLPAPGWRPQQRCQALQARPTAELPSFGSAHFGLDLIALQSYVKMQSISL